MLLVADVKEDRRLPVPPAAESLWGIEKLNVPRSTVPAITHVDYSARIQTVGEGSEPRFRALLEAFDARTGCAVIVNTSLNVRGEPIAESPADAYRCFMRTEMDCLAIGDFLLEKHQQPAWNEMGDWRMELPLD